MPAAPTARPAPLRAVAPLLAALALTGGALFTVQQAGCDDPGRYEPRDGGYELVGGCVAPGDLVVPAPDPALEPVPDTDPDPARG